MFFILEESTVTPLEESSETKLVEGLGAPIEKLFSDGEDSEIENSSQSLDE